MPEVLVRFTETVRGPDGIDYAAQACGGIADDRLWEGWIEFVAPGDPPLRTGRETEQPNHIALMYWAEGLSAAYLEGALRRALDARMVVPRRASTTAESFFPSPARRPGASQPIRVHSVLDPFAAYAQGEKILRQQLSALSRYHLLTLIDAYQLDVVDSAYVAKEDLAEGIVRAVKSYSSTARG
jgi:hypothetical protein